MLELEKILERFNKLKLYIESKLEVDNTDD